MATTELYVKACRPGPRRAMLMAWLAAARQLVPVSSLSDIVSEYAGLLLLNATGASGLVHFEVHATGSLSWDSKKRVRHRSSMPFR